MAWAKGESGNPGGRPKEEREVIQLAREKSTRAIERLCEWIESDNPKASVSACTAVMNRAFGLPSQTLNNNHEVSDTLVAMLEEIATRGRPRPG